MVFPTIHILARDFFFRGAAAGTAGPREADFCAVSRSTMRES
jgi:hypothetical protein